MQIPNHRARRKLLKLQRQQPSPYFVRTPGLSGRGAGLVTGVDPAPNHADKDRPR